MQIFKIVLDFCDAGFCQYKTFNRKIIFNITFNIKIKLKIRPGLWSQPEYNSNNNIII